MNNLKFKICNIFFVLFFVLFPYYISTASAVEPTSTPSANLKSKLKILQDEIASKAADLKDEISKKLQNKVYVGSVKSKSEKSFAISTFSGDKTVTVNDYTIYLGKTKVGDNIAALGDVDDKEVLTAKKIFKLDSAQVQRKAFFGSVASIKDSIINIQTKDSQNFSIQVNQNTSYQLGRGKISFGDIKESRSIVVVGTIIKDTQIKARFIYLLPQTASSSATPSATIKPKQ